MGGKIKEGLKGLKPKIKKGVYRLRLRECQKEVEGGGGYGEFKGGVDRRKIAENFVAVQNL